MEQINKTHSVTKLRSRSAACFLVKYGLKKAVRPINCDLYAYAANNPLRYIDPDGNQSIPSLLDFLNLTSDPHVKIYNDMKASDAGDKHATERLKYVFHEAGNQLLREIGDKSNEISLVFLAIGEPEAASAFGLISTVANGIVALDDFFSGKEEQGLLEAGAIVAGAIIKTSVGKGIQKIGGVKITLGKNGRYYEIGHKGAIKTIDGIKKKIKADIAAGYFGKKIAPETANQLINEATNAYLKVKKELENENN